MPCVADLHARDSCSLVTFPQCALGARAQKYTTFLCTPGLQPALGRLGALTCVHRTHASLVGGTHGQHGWHSATHAAYPPDLNLVIAQAVASRVSLASVPTASDQASGRPPAETTSNQLATRATMRDAATANRSEEPSLAAEPEAARTAGADDHDSLELQRHFQRGLGAYPLRNRSPAALLSVREAGGTVQIPQTSASAMLASTAIADLKTRKQALREDRDGWTAAERTEIANHASNGSWELIDRSAVPHGRSL
eukprot:6190330-Pleurochrysis_carterae.AAC.1